MSDQDKQGHDWVVVLRRRPVRIARDRPESGYTDQFEIVCRDCGDDPDLDYRQASPELQRVRGPYPIGAAITAYVEHTGRHPAGSQDTQETAR
jgi:hypothetical protein